VTDDRYDQTRLRAVQGAGRGLRWSLRSHPLAWWVTSIVVVVTAPAVALGAVRIQAADSDQRAVQLATVAAAVTGLTEAVEDEQDDFAKYIGQGRPPTPDALLLAQGQVSVTNLAANKVISLAKGIGAGYPAQVRSATAAVLTRLHGLAHLRKDATNTKAPALDIIEDYADLASPLLTLDDRLASGLADPTLSADFGALGALARAEDEEAQERAILDDALAANQYQPGDWAALSGANAQEQADLTYFDSEATVAQQQLFQRTVEGQQVNDAQGMLQEALNGGQNGFLPTAPPDHLFIDVSEDWSAEMATQLNRTRDVETGLLEQIQARSAALHAGAVRAVVDTLLEMAAIVLAVVAFAVAATRRRSRSGLAVG
jgi:hypothetical protein